MRWIQSYIHSFQGLSSAAWQGIIIHFLQSLIIGLFYFLMLYFVNELDFNVQIAGSILACYGLGAIVGANFSGRLADSLGAEKVICFSLWLQSITYLILRHYHDLFILMPAMVLLGAASYSFITANTLSVLSHATQHAFLHFKSLNLLSSASNLGLALSALCMSTLLFIIGFHQLFLLASLFSALLALYLHQKKPIILAKPPLSSPTTHRLPRNELHQTPFSTQTKYLVLLIVLFIGCLVAQLSTTLPLYMQALAAESGIYSLGYLFALNSFLIITLETPIGHFINKFNKITMIGIGGGLVGLGMMILNFPHLFAFSIIAIVIYSLGEMIFFSVAQFICYQSAEPKHRGRSLGVYRMTYASSRLLGPSLGASVYQYNSQVLWLGCGFIGIICLVACLIKARLTRSQPLAPTGEKHDTQSLLPCGEKGKG